MKVIVVESKEKNDDGGRLIMIVPEQDLWAVQVLCARAQQKILAIKEEALAS